MSEPGELALQTLDWPYYRSRMAAVENWLRAWVMRRALGRVPGLKGVPYDPDAVKAVAREELERVRDRLFSEQLRARQERKQLRPRSIHWLGRVQTLLRHLEPDELVMYYECIVAPGDRFFRAAFEERAGEVLVRKGTAAQQRRFRELQYQAMSPAEKSWTRLEAVVVSFSRGLEHLEWETEAAFDRLCLEPWGLPRELERLWHLYRQLEAGARETRFLGLRDEIGNRGAS